MTRYEEALENGLPPMKSLEWVLLEIACEDILAGNGDVEDAAYMPQLMIEIEHLYRDDTEKLEKIKEAINNLNGTTI